jgi:predicted DNA-binding protein (MmcQ/YjbR family)
MPKLDRLSRAESALRKFALAYPETNEEFPWEHRAIKVKGKTFLFLYKGADWLSLSVKLPHSGRVALALPFATPTEYGLGKSGWVTARFAPDNDVPIDMIEEWIDESFRAIAPKRVLAKLETAQTNSQPPSGDPAAQGRKRKKR